MLNHKKEFQEAHGSASPGPSDKAGFNRASLGPSQIANLQLELTSLLSSETIKTEQQAAAIALAWSILRECGFPTFGDIRARRCEDFCKTVPVDLREAVSLSLDTVGWMAYAPVPGQCDRAAQMFVRAVALCPLDLARLEKLAIIAGEIKPDQIMNLRHDPAKQAQTAIGFAMQATKHIEYALEEVFGITREALNEASGDSITRLLSVSDEETRSYVVRMLRHVSHLHGLQACFFKNGVHASNAISAGCSALQIVGLPRGIAECANVLREGLREHSPSELLGEETPLIVSILDAISKGLHMKWTLFNNHSAGRRSEQLDELCEILESGSPAK